jgi:hypothetical protein
MSEPIYLALPREDVVSYMGSCWPLRPGEPLLTLAAEAGITDGAAIVYPAEGQPGTAWWVIDSAVPVQDAGTPDEALAAMLPGSTLGTVPSPHPTPHEPPQD